MARPESWCRFAGRFGGLDKVDRNLRDAAILAALAGTDAARADVDRYRVHPSPIVELPRSAQGSPGGVLPADLRAGAEPCRTAGITIRDAADCAEHLDVAAIVDEHAVHGAADDG